MMDGGMLLFEDEEEAFPFLVVAPHAWRGIHTAFDFSKRHRPSNKANKTPRG